jgi:hypothetical protein
MKTFKQFVAEQEQIDEGKGARGAALALGIAGAALGGATGVSKFMDNQQAKIDKTQELIQKNKSPERPSELSKDEMGDFHKHIDNTLKPTDNAIGTMKLYREKDPSIKSGPVIHPDAMIHMNLRGEPMVTKKSAGKFSFGGEPMWKGTPEAKSWSVQTKSKTQTELEDDLIARAKEAAKQYKKQK